MGKQDHRYSAGLIPLDFAILGLLPKQGTKMGRYHDVALRQVDIVRQLDDEYVTIAMLIGRFNALRTAGLVVSVNIPPVTKGKGYQITPEGEHALTAWQAEQTDDGGAS